MLASQFRITYLMILNLLRSSGGDSINTSLQPELMMRKSFFENKGQILQPDIQDKIKNYQSQLELLDLDPLKNCLFCQDMDLFFQLNFTAMESSNNLIKVMLSSSNINNYLNTGRLIIIDHKVYIKFYF